MTDTSPQNEMGTFTDLLKAFAAALAPHMGSPETLNEPAIVSIVSDYLENENVLTGDSVDDAIESWVQNSDDLVNRDNVSDQIDEVLSYSASDYGILTRDDFDPGDYDLPNTYDVQSMIADALKEVDFSGLITREVLATAIAGDEYTVSKRESQAA